MSKRTIAVWALCLLLTGCVAGAAGAVGVTSLVNWLLDLAGAGR